MDILTNCWRLGCRCITIFDINPRIYRAIKFLGRKHNNIFLLICCAILVGGCFPHVSQVVEVIRPLPLGTSHAEVTKALVGAYGRKYRRYPQSYDLSDPAVPATRELLEAEKNVIEVYKRENCYTCVYPSNLLDMVPAPAHMQGVGLAAAGAHGNGHLSLFFDENMNYLGFVAVSHGRPR